MEPPANSMPDPADRSETADPSASTPVVEAPGDAPSAPHPTTPDPPDRPDPHEPHPINWGVFLSSAVIIAVVAAAAIISPTTVQDAFNAAVAWAGKWFGSFYIFLITATIVFVVLLALSRYGQVRLGPDNSTPDFSTFSWAAMLFAAGIGTGIMFFSIAEPVAQYVHPPTGEGETIEAARHAVVLAIFHYGISGWGVYAIMGMAMAYFAYRRRDALAVRSTLRPLLGARVDGWIGDRKSVV